MEKILIIGSSNIDYMVNMDRFPVAGETLEAYNFMQSMGGKGANQAISAFRLGGDVLFVTSLGKDINGKNALDYYKREGLEVLPTLVDDTPTGSAMIWVNSSGENCIVINAGSNKKLTPEVIQDADIDSAIKNSDIILLQMEIPYSTVKKICNKAASLNKTVILNVAPATELDPEIIQTIDFLIVNTVEAEMISGIKYDSNNIAPIMDKLLSLGAKTVILTLGKEGSVIKNNEIYKHIPAFEVKAIDTTGAGDTFCGAFAAELSKGHNWEKALEFATAASAICVTKMGAQLSIPTEEEVINFMKNNNLKLIDYVYSR